MPNTEYIAMIAFDALSDPVRRDILALLCQGEQTVGSLVTALARPQPNVSKHLKTLRQAGMVRVRIDGPKRLYSIDPAPLAELDAWLNPYRSFWDGRLEAVNGR